MTSRFAVRLSHVHKTYSNGTTALQDMSLEILPSQFISLVGPSGCGKSTVLKILSGLGSLSSGKVEWGLPERQHKLAYVFQDAALMPWATVMGNICLPLKLQGIRRDEALRSAQETLRLVGLQGFERSYPRELSGGMKMRVSIARALVTQPNVLLMDEPFGALDEITRSKLNAELLDLWSQQRWTVIFVTHNIYEAVYLSNRVVVMAARPGRVVAEVAINAPDLRTEEFRTSALYNDYCREVSRQLYQAMDPHANHPAPVT